MDGFRSRVVGVALCVVWLGVGNLGCVAHKSAADIPKIAYPSPPPAPVTETAYTQKFRERLREAAGPAPDEEKKMPEESIDDTIRRLYR